MHRACVCTHLVESLYAGFDIAVPRNEQKELEVFLCNWARKRTKKRSLSLCPFCLFWLSPSKTQSCISLPRLGKSLLFKESSKRDAVTHSPHFFLLQYVSTFFKRLDIICVMWPTFSPCLSLANSWILFAQFCFLPFVTCLLWSWVLLTSLDEQICLFSALTFGFLLFGFGTFCVEWQAQNLRQISDSKLDNLHRCSCLRNDTTIKNKTKA